MGRVILWIQGHLLFDRVIFYIWKISASWHFRKGQTRKKDGRDGWLLFSQLWGLLLEEDTLRIYFVFDKQSLSHDGISACGDCFEKNVRCSWRRNHLFSRWLKQCMTFDFWMHLISSNQKASFLSHSQRQMFFSILRMGIKKKIVLLDLFLAYVCLRWWSTAEML